MDTSLSRTLQAAPPFSVAIEWSALGPRPRNAEAAIRWWNDLTGQTLRESRQWGWLDAVHPDDRDMVRQAWQRAIDGAEPYLAVFRVLTPADGNHLVLAYGTPIHEEGESITGWTGRLIDITQYERTTEYAAAMSSLIGSLGRAWSTPEILKAALESLQSSLQPDAGAILLQNSAGHLELGATFGIDEAREAAWRAPDGGGRAVSTVSAPLKEPVWIERVEYWDEEYPECLQVFAGHGFASFAAIPLVDSEMHFGDLALAFRDERQFTEIDREFIRAIALQVARGLLLTRTLDAEREARDSSELAHQHLHLVADAVPALIASIDPDFTFRFSNTTFPAWFALDEAIPEGSPIEEVVGQAVFAQLEPPLERAMAGEFTTFELSIEQESGEPRLVSLTLVPNLARTGEVQGLALLGFDVSERERTIRRAQYLIDLSAALSHLLTYEEMVEVIIRLAPNAIGATSMAITLASTGQAMVWTGPWEGDGGRFEHIFVPPDDPMWKAMEERRPLIVDHPSEGSEASPVLQAMPDAQVQGQRIVLPMIAESRRTGVLVFAMPRGAVLTAEDVAYLTLLTGICAGALDRARLHDFMRARESRFRELADALPQIVWVSSGDGKTLEYLNDRWREYTGLQPHEMRAGETSLLTHPADRDEERRRWQHSLRTGDLFEAEIRLRGNDGTYRWFLNRGVPVRSEDGRIESWFGTMTDINAQHETLTHQRVISGLDAQIRLLFDPTQILQALVTTIGRHFEVERCFVTEVIDHIPLRETESQPITETATPNIALRALWLEGTSTHPDDIRGLAPMLSRQYANQLRRGQIVAMNDIETDEERQEVREIAARLGVRAFIMIPFLRAGRWVAGLTLHARTPRKWSAGEVTIADAALKRTWPLVERSRAVEALAESENRLRQAAEAANFSSFDFDPRTGAGNWSADTTRVFRKPPDSSPPESLEELVSLVHPDDQARLRELFVQSIDPKSNGEIFGEFRLLTDDGETCWFLLRGTTQFQGEGADRVAVRISGILMDITARKREEEERLISLDAASHDLKNPVAAIRALAQVGMRLNQNGDDQITEILRSIESATDRISSVISDIMDTARLRAGRELPLQLRMVSLQELLRERIEEWTGAHPEREFILNLEERSIEGCWDPERLRRVFDNLISNAVKFSPDGGEIRLDAALENRDGTSWARITIADRGIGIAAADLTRVQRTFERGSNVPESIPGTGMGLMAARLITQQHGGSLELQSEENAGTTVEVRLPVSSCPGEEPPAR